MKMWRSLTYEMKYYVKWRLMNLCSSNYNMMYEHCLNLKTRKLSNLVNERMNIVTSWRFRYSWHNQDEANYDYNATRQGSFKRLLLYLIPKIYEKTNIQNSSKFNIVRKAFFIVRKLEISKKCLPEVHSQLFQ